MEFLQLLRYVSRGLAALVFICYFYQIVYLIVPFFGRKKAYEGTRQGRYAVLIAARNEQAVLPFLLDSIAGQDYPRELVNVFVVADNCTDNTAKVARAGGARVFERFDSRRVGKGYALNYLLECIDEAEGLDGYDAFLVFDADNLLCSSYISEINKLYSQGYEAFCGYRNSKNFADNWISSGYALWYMHDSVHLNQSRMMLGTTCAVTGTGFGFTRTLLEKCGGWKFFTLTEDIEFDTWCAVNGVRIGFTPDAMLYDEQPTTFRQSWRQRTRWVQGGVQVSLKYAPALFRGMLRGGRRGYACFEAATLSLWGYGVSALAMGLAMTCTFVTERWPGVLLWLGAAIINMYLALLPVGVLTLWSERERISAGRRERIIAAATFPLFMMTYVPIAVSSLFRSPVWLPIEHKVAVPVSSMAAR